MLGSEQTPEFVVEKNYYTFKIPMMMVILEVNQSRHLSYRTGYLASTRFNFAVRRYSRSGDS